MKMTELSRAVGHLCVALGLIGPTLTNVESQAPRTHGMDMPLAMRGFLGVELNRDDLASVQRRLGRVSAWATGDAGDAKEWWCYRRQTQPGEAGAVLLLSSDGEMGGSEHEVDEMRLLRPSRRDTLLKRCSILPSAQSLTTPGGLGLGLSRAEVIRLLGAPRTAVGDSVAYRWAARQFLRPTDPAYAYWNARRKECFEGKAPYVDVTAGLVVHFDQGSATAIHLSRFDEAIC